MEIALLSGVAVVDPEDAVVVLLDLLLLLIVDGWFLMHKKNLMVMVIVKTTQEFPPAILKVETCTITKFRKIPGPEKKYLDRTSILQKLVFSPSNLAGVKS